MDAKQAFRESANRFSRVDLVPARGKMLQPGKRSGDFQRGVCSRSALATAKVHSTSVAHQTCCSRSVSRSVSTYSLELSVKRSGTTAELCQNFTGPPPFP